MHYEDFKRKPHNLGIPENEIWRRYQLYMEQEMFKQLNLQLIESKGESSSSSSSASAAGGGAQIQAEEIPTDPFEFTVNTATGSTANNQFKLPLTASTGLNCIVDWGDGTSNTITNHLAPEVTHTYASSGVYTVKISGNLLGWSFNNGGDKDKILNISKWGSLNISVSNGFFNCRNLTCSATDAPKITSTSLASYFRDCINFNGAIGNWDVSNVTNFGDMLRAATFNQDISGWNTSNAINMENMFRTAARFNQPIGSWNVSNVLNMQSMFREATDFNQDIGSWDVSKVGSNPSFGTGFYRMFYLATSFNNGGSPSIDNWDLSNYSSSLSLGINEMFRNASSFNQPIGSWNVGNVSSFAVMFEGAFSFNQNIGSWNTGNVTQMNNMFRAASSFNQDISDWNITNVTNFTNFMAFKSSTDYSATYLDNIYNKWSLQPVKPNLSISFGTIKYTAAGQAGKDVLDFAPNNWTIIDGGI